MSESKKVIVIGAGWAGLGATSHLAEQGDVVWCRGTVGEKIFKPWIEKIEQAGGQVLTNKRVSDIVVDETGKATGVKCGDEFFDADAIISSVSITGMKKIVESSSTLNNYAQFRNLSNLKGKVWHGY